MLLDGAAVVQNGVLLKDTATGETLVRRTLAALTRLDVPAVLGRTRALATALPAGRAPPLSL